MAASVAAPIERQLSTIAGITSMTSTSSLGSTQITIQFDLNRNIDGAALDVQTALAVAQRRPAGRDDDAAELPQGQSRRLPGALLSACAPTRCRCRRSTTTPRRCWRRRSRRLPGVAQVLVFGAQKFAVRVQVDPVAAAARGISLDDVRSVVAKANSNDAGRHAAGRAADVTLLATGADDARRRLPRRGRRLAQRRAGPAQRDRQRHRQRRERQDRELVQRRRAPSCWRSSASPTPTPSRWSTRCASQLPAIARAGAAGDPDGAADRPLDLDPRTRSTTCS